jgi:predicted dehydrogenase
VWAAGAGKRVFCEKPLMLSKVSAERAIAACEQAGVVLGIGHERCHRLSERDSGDPILHAFSCVWIMRLGRVAGRGARHLDAFAAAVSGGPPYPFTREQKLHNIAVLQAVIRSVDCGEAVPVP